MNRQPWVSPLPKPFSKLSTYTHIWYVHDIYIYIFLDMPKQSPQKKTQSLFDSPVLVDFPLGT